MGKKVQEHIWGSGTHYHIRIAYPCKIHMKRILINRAWEEKACGSIHP